MLSRTNKPLTQRILLIDDTLSEYNSTRGRVLAELIHEFQQCHAEVVQAISYDDAQAAIVSDAGLHACLLDWTLGNNDSKSHQQAMELLRIIRSRNATMPIFLMADKAAKHSLTLEAMELADEFIWLLEDTAPFIVGRVLAAVRRYLEKLLPPFTDALLRYSQQDEHSWAAPGHQGGIAFTKTAIGRIFFDFFGENLFRTDGGIERGNLGSILDHSGPVKDSEDFVARIFGAHASYAVLTGTSGSNRAIFMACVGENQFALCDRNCHKSIEQGLVLTGGIPVYLTPSRNRYGIIGPLLPDQYDASRIQQQLEEHPLAAQAQGNKATFAVVTNCTYDGMCAHAEQVEELLAASVDRIHFDEAWYGYARFNPMYQGRYAMRGSPSEHAPDAPTVFATHSTHKLLAALSQSSYIHIRNGKRPIEHSRFNESFVLQASTSPLYSLFASNEVGAAMMQGDSGYSLTQDAIREAVDFRQALARAEREFKQKGDWFFSSWNAPQIKDHKSGSLVDFADADPDQLCSDPACWVLEPGASWHGFSGLSKGWCLLDPIKAGILVPGMADNGTLSEHGIPAAVVSAYLYQNNIIPSRTTDFMVLCLFSIGITKGKWGTLLNVLLSFKRHYDANTDLAHALPKLLAQAPERYQGMGLKDLCNEMFAYMRASQMDALQAAAFDQLPAIAMTPRAAFQRLQQDEAELLTLEQAANRITAVGIMPYPPGIPIVMPGENLGPIDGPWLQYIQSLQNWGNTFPGFEKEVEGAVHKDGQYHFWCLP
ncbi:Orn/Lys/Arg family decarboxylase [Alkalimonas mucilaginosa]|uniref:Orn/Lys/Arg decarboxylase N-terminal domain-containing protein n=1 Tax=Alkalimonas mucilaginosa TaxID=3057676 RepID=A0ABU7JKA0_9GAMM|nr:Orn/Lys/Arg decarboxylase N-terminal domain-containing protein [Alkalimonas sp. MEB004]MEE2025851.1 Orn/Lys/Arg decarboxylase N-terminal domain-containing protein [Alkalimonas sp. MEB004]